MSLTVEKLPVLTRLSCEKPRAEALTLTRSEDRAPPVWRSAKRTKDFVDSTALVPP